MRSPERKCPTIGADGRAGRHFLGSVAEPKQTIQKGRRGRLSDKHLTKTGGSDG